MTEPLDVFFSYAHQDEDLRDELAVHLAILERQGKIRPWHDRQITGGQEWAGEIDDKLNAADLILLLVSPTFVASDYCWDVELKRSPAPIPPSLPAAPPPIPPAPATSPTSCRCRRAAR